MVHMPPEPQQDPLRKAEKAEIEQLLATLEAIPRDELPDGEDRNALAMLIRYGLVDNLYRPLGADYHNIAWALREPWQDPRERITDWREARRRFWQLGELPGVKGGGPR